MRQLTPLLLCHFDAHRAYYQSCIPRRDKKSNAITAGIVSPHTFIWNNGAVAVKNISNQGDIPKNVLYLPRN
ncbi:MAG: hypothetical protein ACI30K_04085 [Muribaculaceae bacterium]